MNFTLHPKRKPNDSKSHQRIKSNHCSCKKVASSKIHRSMLNNTYLWLTLTLVLELASAPHILALPQEADVITGEIDINERGDTLIIEQNSEQAIVNYDSFSIAADETVTFIQPNQNSAILNRVTGNNLSEIYGDIEANGKVFLANPNGVMFSEGSQIDVGSLVVTTGDINNNDFINHRFTIHDIQEAALLNDGKITSHHQDGVIFVAPVIINNGSIEALGGDIHLATGQAIIHQSDDSPIGVLVNDTLLHSHIDNSGQLTATSIVSRHGEIYLTGTEKTPDGPPVDVQSDIYNSGTLTSASGTVVIQANRVAQQGIIDVSAISDTPSASDASPESTNTTTSHNAGNINLYGNTFVTATSDSKTFANASSDGDAGNIILFSANTTRLQAGATIEATADGGNGGFVDVSGIQRVEVFGTVDVSSNSGNHGDFLIDPEDIVIGNTDNLVTTTSPFQASASGSSTLSAATIEAALAGGGNVEIRTDVDQGDSDGGNITITSDIDLDGSNGGSLSLVADGNIVLNSAITIGDFTSATPDATLLSFISGGSLSMQDTSTVDAGSGFIVITAGGLAQISSLRSSSTASNAINITASQILDAGDSDIDLIANAGGAVISSATGFGNISYIETSLNTIDLNIGSAGNVRIAESDDITITHLSNVTNLDVNAPGGALILPDAGIAITGDLEIISNDLYDVTDHNVILSANNAYLDINALSDNTIVNSDFNQLDLSVGGVGIEVINSNALNLIDFALDADSNVVNFSTLATTVRTTSGDLTISSDINLDGAGSGILSLGTNNSQLIFANDSTITDQNTATTDNATVQLLGGDITMQDATLIDVGGGKINVFANNITLGGLTSTHSDNDAINLDVVNIVDAGSTYTDIVTTMGGTTLTATGDIGAAGDIELNTNTLTINSAGLVRLNEVDDLTIILAENISDLDLDVSNGTITTMDGGINVTGNLNLYGKNITHNLGGPVILSADSLFLDITQLASSTTFNTSVNSLDGQIIGSSGAELLAIHNDKALILNDTTSDTNTDTLALDLAYAEITTDTGDLTLANNFDLNHLNTSDLIFTAAQNLTLNQNITLSDSSTITSDDVNLSFIAGNNLNASNDNLIDSGAGTISIIAGNRANISDFFTTNTTDSAIVIQADSVRGGSGSVSTDLSAVNGRIQLTTNGDFVGQNGNYFELDSDSLSVSTTTGEVRIQSFTDINLVEATGLSRAVFYTPNDFIIHDAGLNSASDLLEIYAADIHDSDRDIIIRAQNVLLDISNSSDNLTINTNIDAMDLRVNGLFNTTVIEQDSLTYSDFDGDTVAIANINGDLTTQVLMGNLIIADTINIDGSNGASLSFDTVGGSINFNNSSTITDLTPATADAVDINLLSSADIHMQDETRIDVGAGTIDMNAGDTLTLTGLITSSSDFNAVSLSANSIVDGGDSVTDISASRGGAIFNSSGNIGINDIGAATTALETDLSYLTINNSNQINIYEADDLRLITDNSLSDITINASNGRLVIDNAGLTTSNTLNIYAQDLQSLDQTDLNLATDTLFLSITGLTLNSTINNSVNHLDGQIVGATGSENLTLINDRSLTLIDSLQDANSNTLTLDLANVSLQVTSGDLTLNDNLDTNNLNGSTLSFNAANDLIFSDGIEIEDSDTTITNNVNINLISGNNIQANNSNFVNAGTGTIHINAGNRASVSGFTSTNAALDAITISADSIRGRNGATNRLGTDLSAINGGVQLTSATTILGETDNYFGVNSNTLFINGNNNDIRIQSLNDIHLLEANNLMNTTFLTPGNFIISESGLSSSAGLLDITAADIFDNATVSPRDIDINAENLLLNLTNISDNLTINTTVDAIDLSTNGLATTTILAANTLTFIDLNNDAMAASITNGSLTTEVINGDLIIEGDILATDLNADGIRAGMLDFINTNGDIFVGNTNNLSIRSVNSVDQNTQTGLDFPFMGDSSNTSLQLSLANNDTLDRTIALGSATTSVQLSAQGGDVAIHGISSDANNLDTPDTNFSTIEIYNDSNISSYNQLTDELSGILIVNGKVIASNNQLKAFDSRAILFQSQPSTNGPVPNPTADNVLIENITARNSESESIIDKQLKREEKAVANSHADTNFDAVYANNGCINIDDDDQKCEVNHALKRFFSHWTLGNQLPPTVQ